MARGDSDRVFLVGQIDMLAGRLKHHNPKLIETLRTMQSGFSSGRAPSSSDNPDRTGNAGVIPDPARDDMKAYDELLESIHKQLVAADSIRESWMSCPWCGHGWDAHERASGKPPRCTRELDDGKECNCKPPATPAGVPSCDHHKRFKDRAGRPLERLVAHPKTNVKGNLPRKMRLCRWCYEHALKTSMLPPSTEVLAENEGRIVVCHCLGQVGKKAS